MSKIIFWDTACINCGEKAINHKTNQATINCPKGFVGRQRSYKKIKGVDFVDSRDKTKWKVWSGRAGKYILVGDVFTHRRISYYKLRKHYV